MKNFDLEISKRVLFIQEILKNSGSDGIVFANSGGKDCALSGILCKMACENTLSVCMPCGIKRSYNEDLKDAIALADRFNIKNIIIDLAETESLYTKSLSSFVKIKDSARTNFAPRLRMMTLYAIGNSENRLVAGTSNISETYVGYFTKWGDGAHDFNPIADLTATEVIEFLKYLKAPECIINKAPSAGLYEGQTDEKDLGITYADLDNYIRTGVASPENKALIDHYHKQTEHKRSGSMKYGGEPNG